MCVTPRSGVGDDGGGGAQSKDAQSKDAQSDDDARLAGLARAGDRAAFETLLRRHGPALHRYARRMIRDGAAVDDVVQETFVAAWRQIAHLRADAAVRTWLFAICARKVVDSRRVKRAVPIDDRLIEPLTDRDAATHPFTAASNAAFLGAVEAALAELPVRQRAVWLLREVERLPFTEIGTILSLSADGARGHHHRARTALARRLRQWQ